MTQDRPPIIWARRLLDLVLSLLALTLLGPIILLVAVLIKLSSPGPVLYVAQRAGYKGQAFGLLKFRTMRAGADRHGSITAQDDSRVFGVGRILRLFKLDELPQILNVLRGEMSIVGPRPEDLEIVRGYYTAEQRQVLEVLPGLTGIPQVRFFPEFSQIDTGGMDPQDHYCQVILPMRLEMDLEYIRTRSFWRDLYLIGATVFLITLKAPYIALFGQRTRPVPNSWRSKQA